MPIQLDNIQSFTNSSQKLYTPKFFNQKLTGVGKKSGILCADRNPFNIVQSGVDSHVTQSAFTTSIIRETKTFTNGPCRVTQIPLALFPSDILEDTVAYCHKVNAGILMNNQHGLTIETPDSTVFQKIGTMPNTNTELFLTMIPDSLILEEIEQTSGPKIINLDTKYRIIVCAIDKSAPDKKMTVSMLPVVHNIDTTLYNKMILLENTTDPYTTLNDLATVLANTHHATINQTAISDFFGQYDLYTSICRVSELWNTESDTVIAQWLCVCEHAAQKQNSTFGFRVNSIIEKELKYLENYSIPLELYKKIYQALQSHFPQECGTLCKQNLNLLLSDTLFNLNQKKQSLARLTPQPTAMPQSLQKFSREQQNAIASSEPLILIQSGAGCGKSTVILGRINYMIDCGVNPHDITVLSFTNAAADHITEKCPTINSMTIARMIHSIYELNFQHELSSLETIVNALDIYFPTKRAQVPPLTKTAQEFKNKLYDLIKDANKFTAINNFVEDHYDEVIQILDTINQTSLELEIIICYQKIDSLKEPASVQSKFLIIDEVQDNSVFEFIYALKYVNKHNESLFIVGDCSQTLYEFRASNPKALNILEGSGVFDTHRLQINYRSNQEILDFANVGLGNIEANQYAQIQLQANSLAPVTAKSFMDKVRFKYHCLSKISETDDMLGIAFNTDIKDYIDEKLANGEQVAILAFTRKTLDKIQNILLKTHPGKSVVSLVPKRIYNSTVFSTFVKRYWYDATSFAPVNSIMATIDHDIMYNLSALVRDVEKSKIAVQKSLMRWQNENKAVIQGWEFQYNSGAMTKDKFLDLVKDNLIQFEIKENAMKQSLISANNSQNKQENATQNANILLSTIHSAKGLEFDNVIVLYRDENTMDEDKKRMYYVALTRAMKSEFILAYNTVKCPKIESDYNSIVKKLQGSQTPVNAAVNA